VFERVFGEFFDVVVDVTQVNQGSWITELAIHQEVSNLNGIIESSLSNNSLNFLKVAHSSTCLNILKVDVWIVRVWQHIAQEQQQTFVGAILLQNFN
jgi:hypothetical protein